MVISASTSAGDDLERHDRAADHRAALRLEGVSDPVADASSRKSSMSWRETSNGLSSTSQSSRSSTDSSSVGPEVGELVDDGGTSSDTMPAMHEQEPERAS